MFLNKGVDVFLEKPIATTFDDASSLVSTSIHEGKTLKSGFLYGFIRASSMLEPKSDWEELVPFSPFDIPRTYNVKVMSRRMHWIH